VQLRKTPETQSNSSSATSSQSSSAPLHLSAGGVHPPSPHADVQVADPVDPHVVVQGEVDPATHSNPLSATSSQSSSAPLHLSAGGVHPPSLHVDVQVTDPVDPHVVIQGDVDPATQSNPLSVTVSQSSSMPLHNSCGPVQSAPVGGSHWAVQVPVPADPQVVVHDTSVPVVQT
jgi:hypothetical protein